MQYGKVKFVDKPVSKLVFGTAAPAFFAAMRSLHGAEPGFDAALENAFLILDQMYVLGVNAVDCSNHYGEEPVGEWLESRKLHDKVVVLTKGAHHNAWRKRVTPYDIQSDVHDSLKKLKTEHIDIYVLHRDDPDVPVGPIVEVLNELHRAGKIGAFGGSNWTNERISQANDYARANGLLPFTVSSPNYGLCNQISDPWGGGCVTVSGPENAGKRLWYAQNGIPIFAYSVMGRGFFSGRLSSDHPEDAAKYLDEAGVKGYVCPENFERLRRAEALAREKGVTVSDVAMAFLFNQAPLEVFAVTGASSPEHMKANISASEMILTPQECRYLDLQ